MAAVLTLDETPPRAESCSFCTSLGTFEVPADEGDTPGREGLDSADMETGNEQPFRHSGTVGSSAPHALPPIRYHARFRAPNDDVWQQIRAGEAASNFCKDMPLKDAAFSPETPTELVYNDALAAPSGRLTQR
jgi:hypothetical protein